MTIINFIYIYCLLIKLDFLLKCRGFPTVFELYVNKYELIKITNYKTEKIEEVNLKIKKLLVLIEFVCSCYPGKAKCIHKSFLSYRLLRQRYKIPLKLVIGVSHFPFEAHAWIMQGKYNIGDESINTDKYKIILDSSERRTKFEVVYGRN